MPSRLMHLRVDKFRHVKPGTTINFGARFNTVVGQNGAGKTTLLELVSAIVRNDFRAFAREEFRVSFRLVDGDYTLEGRLRNVIDNMAHATPRLELAGTLLHGAVSIVIESDTNESKVTFSGQVHVSTSIIRPMDAPGGGFDIIHAARLALPPHVPELTALRKTVTADILGSMQRIACDRLTEGLETFVDLFFPHIVPEHAPPLGISIASSGPYGPYSTGHHLSDETYLPQIKRQTNIIDIITIDNTAPMLADFISLSQYTDARLLLTKTSSSIIQTVTRTVYANPLARFTTRSGNEIPHHHLSFGEKRLLTFLIKLYAYPHIIIVDELANGMHHAWIERCIELMEDLGTQAFLSSQNPLLLDCLPLTRETYGTDHALVICEFSDTGEMIWRNLSEAETTDFFKSLDVGIQHVSEIMRSKGLW